MFNFEGHQQTNGLEGVDTSVNVVAQEEIVVTGYVSTLGTLDGELPYVEEAHEIDVLAVQISEHFYWWLYIDHQWLRLDHCLTFGDQLNDVMLLERESARRTVLLPILGMKQSIEEQVAKGLLGVLHNLVASTSLIATNFLRLLLQFVNRDLSNEHGEVFSRCIFSIVHGDVSLLS